MAHEAMRAQGFDGRRKTMIRFISTVAASFGLAVTALAAGAAPESIGMRRTAIAQTAIAAVVDDWCVQVSAATQSRVRCTAVPGSTTSTDAYAALKASEVDIGVVNHRDHPVQFPISRLAELPRLGDFAETVSPAYQRAYDRMPAMAAEHGDWKVIAVFTDAPAYFFLPAGQLRTVAELKGRHVTLTHEADAGLSQALRLDASSAASPIASNDTSRIRLSTATSMFQAPDTASFRTAAMVPGGLARVSYALVLSRRVWLAMSADDQRAVASLSGAKLAASFGHAIDAAEWKANMKERGNGVAFYPATDALTVELSKSLQPLDHAWRLAAQRAGVKHAGQALVDFRKDIESRELAE